MGIHSNSSGSTAYSSKSANADVLKFNFNKLNKQNSPDSNLNTSYSESTGRASSHSSGSENYASSPDNLNPNKIGNYNKTHTPPGTKMNSVNYQQSSQLLRLKNEVIEINEQTMFRDAIQIYNFLTEKLKARPDQIHLMGRSIGSGPAIYLAKERKVASLTLMSAFSSLREVVQQKTGAFLSFLGKVCPDFFKNADNIGSVICPILFIHGKEDSLVGFKHSQELYKRAVNSQMKNLFICYGMDHSKLKLQEDFLDHFLEF